MIDDEGKGNKEDAALHIGVALESFNEMIKNGILEEKQIYEKDELDHIVKKYLPKFKVWSSLTSKTQDFIESLKKSRGIDAKMQECEIEGCGHVAYQKCFNDNCRPERKPRVICLKHGKWIKNNKSMVLHPDVLCDECVKLVQEGKLKGFELFLK